MSKAKYQGTCQICGSLQKLPNGVLSLHGYDVRWGFFNGTCPGARHLPFEQSKDLIEDAIARAQAQAIAAGLHAVDLDKPATEPRATCQIYREKHQCRTYEKAGYALVTGRIEKREPRHGLRYVVIADDEREYYVHGDTHTGDKLTVASYNNRQFAKKRRIDAQLHRDYAEWQARRIANWMPSELTPVPPEVECIHFEATIYKITTAFCAGSLSRARMRQNDKRTSDRSKVTCVECLKKLTSRDKSEREAAEKAAKRAHQNP